jgi:hypothetical protein
VLMKDNGKLSAMAPAVWYYVGKGSTH